VRVVAGRLGGRRLRAPAGRATRPTSDRVREALFAALGDVTGTEVLDLFAGSGALGIEALSRGADGAVFVERAPVALRALRGNLSDLGLDAEVRPADARAALRALGRAGRHFDLVLVDPPYALADRIGADLDRLLPPVLAAGARVVCESDRRAPIALELPVLDRRRYGDTLLTVHAARDG
jgi:16S rRNA (guanine966-N2)-methyltransferase